MRSFLTVLLVVSSSALGQGLKPGSIPVLQQPFTAQLVVTTTQLLADGTKVEHVTSTDLARDSRGRTWSHSEVISRIHFGQVRRSTSSACTTLEQHLADGTTVRASTTLQTARDSSGRTMRQAIYMCGLGPDGQGVPVVQVSVTDPAHMSTLNWKTGGWAPPVATSGQIRNTRKVSPEESAASQDEQKKMQEFSRAQNERQRVELQTENLGTRTIQGVTAAGTRTTRTIPAGEEGNDSPLRVVGEQWVAHQLGLVLLSIQDDPRSGRITESIEDLKLGEPDAALFLPPPTYKIVESKPLGD